VRQGYRPGPEVGHALPAAGPAEVQHLPVRAGHPLQAFGGLELAAPAQRLPVQSQGGGGVVFLRLDAERTEPGGLRQVRSAGAEPEGRPVRRPGQRDAAPVAALVRAAGPPEGGIFATVVGNVRDFVQAEFLPLVEVGRPGQRQHQQGGRPGPPGAGTAIQFGGEVIAEQPCLGRRDTAEMVLGRQRVPGGVPDHVVIGQHPRDRRSVLLRVGQVVGDDPQELPARPVGFEQVEVEGLAQPGQAGVPRPPGRVHPCLRHADPRRVVLVEDLPPFGVDLMDFVPVPERMGPRCDR